MAELVVQDFNQAQSLGFETYITCEVLNPAFATNIANWTQYAPTIVWSAGEGHIAVGALSIAEGGGSGYQALTIPAGTRQVKITFWAKGTTGEGMLWTFGNIVTGPTQEITFPDANWHQYEHEFQYRNDGTWVYFFSEAVSHAVYIDDVTAFTCAEGLTQHHALALADFAQAQTLAATVLGVGLVVGDFNLLQSLSEPAFTQHNILVVQDFKQSQTLVHMRYVLEVQNMTQAQIIEQVMLTYWFTIIDWVKDPHVEPAKGTRRLLHPLHWSRFRH